jgi:hypothetical protein
VLQRNVHVRQRDDARGSGHRRGGGSVVRRWLALLPGFGIGLALQGVGKVVQTVHPGREAAQALETLHDHRQRAEHGGKRTRRLHGTAHLHATRQHVVGHDHAGQDDGEKAVRVLEQVELELPAQHLLVVLLQRGKQALQHRHLARLATVESDGLGVLAHTHQVEAEVGLALQLPEIQANQAPSEHGGGQEGAEHRVRQQKIHQPARDAPQHAGKRHQLGGRTQHDHGKVQRLLREGVDVLGDALVGVVQPGHGVEPVVGALLEVALQEVVGQPAPPAQAQGVAHVVVQRVDRHPGQQDQGVAVDGGPEALGVARGQGGGEFAAFLVEPDAERGLAQQQHHQQQQQAARAPAFVRAPVRRRHGHKTAPQAQVETGRRVGIGGRVHTGRRHRNRVRRCGCNAFDRTAAPTGQQKTPLFCKSRVLNLVGAIGLEPTTPTMSRWCSNQLSYAPGSVTRLVL